MVVGVASEAWSWPLNVLSSACSLLHYGVVVPMVDVAYQNRVRPDQLLTLAQALAHAVSLAVAYPEEPYDGDLQPGDVELRLHARAATTALSSTCWSRSVEVVRLPCARP